MLEFQFKEYIIFKVFILYIYNIIYFFKKLINYLEKI